MTSSQTRDRDLWTQLPTPRPHRRLFALWAVIVVAASALVVVPRLLDDEKRDYLSTSGWPEEGQGAYVLGSARPAVSPHQRPVPIASLAKVMTAYLVVEHYPSRASSRFEVRPRDVVDADARRSLGQSIVPVRAGEVLTRREALMAILLPSANNVAVIVARQLAGSVPAFVARMNRTARGLGMTETTYTDPSGYDAKTVSTALDQLRLARVVARNRTLTEIMATTRYSLPVAGVVTNTDSLLGRDGFVGMKTGSHDAAGGCFMFRTERQIDGHRVTLIGVVLGQRGRSLITAGLSAARQLADRVAPHAARVELPAGGRRPGAPPVGRGS